MRIPFLSDRRERAQAAARAAAREGDAILLDRLAEQGGWAAPRHWVHFLYAPGEIGARQAEIAARAAGWDIRRIGRPEVGPGRVIVVEKHGATVEPATVAAAREFFEDLAGRISGGVYDGWEASERPDPTVKA
ncbi:MAG: ribonuclease E inhibitor RraB [Bifidobacteriaceae bacterium]|jgi:hypothetical protein|nr:ribonuclease E inhibitor RraB [Bifidobacteriaceae bacterium]